MFFLYIIRRAHFRNRYFFEFPAKSTPAFLTIPLQERFVTVQPTLEPPQRLLLEEKPSPDGTSEPAGD